MLACNRPALLNKYMNAYEFLKKWQHRELNERAASQSHFNDLCALSGVADPITADPKGEWFAFEKGATKTGGGEGWADVWKRGCFAWEYKGPRKNLDAAFHQLLQYSVALENPPLLIVSDMDRIRIHTNWTNTVQEVHDFNLEDLIDAGKRQKLRAAFTDPDVFKPTKTRQALTEETAGEFATLAQRLRDRGHAAHLVAHFINRLVFCMFAEDVGLLPDHLFTKMLESSRSKPADFTANAQTLFAAMAHPGGKVGFTAIDWFNGGLFENDHVLPLSADDIYALIKAARRDWSAIDPSILGTLFERGLDPAKRSQLGAHYTDRAKIMMIVQPVIIDPLLAEWAAAKAAIEAAMNKVAEAKSRTPVRQQDARKIYAAARRAEESAFRDAQRIRNEFLVRLRNFRVLDPACGSGNFLYIALRALKDIELRVNIEAESLGVEKAAPAVGPECVLGIELNPYAAELARVSVWIGEIQWMRSNGFDAARNPILRPLNTIECRDAVLNDDGTQATWPAADVVVGNPPFLGNKKMIGELGEEYTVALRKAWPEVSGGVDLVCYWFAKAWKMMAAGKVTKVGLVATNSIRGGANRDVLKPIVDQGQIFEAWSDQEWTVDGAAVRVALICFSQKDSRIAQLDGGPVSAIFGDLTASASSTDLSRVPSLPENAGSAFIGDQKSGPFNIAGTTARSLITQPTNVNGRSNIEVVRPWLNGSDLTTRCSDTWIIDFGPHMSMMESALFEKPFEIVLRDVKPTREGLRRANHRENWWIHGEARPGMRKALVGFTRFIISPRVSKFRLFKWVETQFLADSATVAIARDDDTSFGILHSRFHELWSLRMGTFLGVGNDPRYTPSTTFETFPFPEGLTPNIAAAAYADDPRAQAIAGAAARLNELRENWLNPADLVQRVPEVVPGYPDRILPRDDAAAKQLQKRTLTNLYNARPQWLANAHAALDAAVADAYGWGDDFRAGALTDDEILARLFQLNQKRAATQ
jgi:type II restriction/modification system DNA methylase subunit YeeA